MHFEIYKNILLSFGGTKAYRNEFRNRINDEFIARKRQASSKNQIVNGWIIMSYLVHILSGLC